ncbi:MAG: hypothetical protein AAGB18_07485 [Pseudomonadota bacterium]
MDDQLHRGSHGSYGERKPLDYGGSGTGGGALIVIILLALIVLGALFFGPSGEPGAEVPAAAPAASETNTSQAN